MFRRLTSRSFRSKPRPREPVAIEKPWLADRRHIPTEDDVLAVRQQLLQYLPGEIVHLVLDAAEYWPCFSFERESDPPFQVAAPRHFIGGTTSRCYLVSSCIPEKWSKCESVIKLRRVVFHIISNDQGWTTDDIPEGAGASGGPA